MKKIWFRRKLYGWGWTPASWEGWLATAVYIFIVIINTLRLSSGAVTQTDFLISILVLTLLFILITFLTGESPKWQWGTRKDTPSQK